MFSTRSPSASTKSSVAHSQTTHYCAHISLSVQKSNTASPGVASFLCHTPRHIISTQEVCVSSSPTNLNRLLDEQELTCPHPPEPANQRCSRLNSPRARPPRTSTETKVLSRHGPIAGVLPWTCLPTASRLRRLLVPRRKALTPAGSRVKRPRTMSRE